MALTSMVVLRSGREWATCLDDCRIFSTAPALRVARPIADRLLALDGPVERNEARRPVQGH
jgi:hypothetical protein